jgi:hypothetical protein
MLLGAGYNSRQNPRERIFLADKNILGYCFNPNAGIYQQPAREHQAQRTIVIFNKS